MTEIALTQRDIKRIKNDIKLTLILGMLFTIGLIILLFITPLILTLFNKPADGFANRALFIIGLVSLPFIGISWKNIVKYIDLIRSRKISFKTSDYEIKKGKDGFILSIETPLKLKFDLYDKLPELLRLGEPIKIELTRLSKTLLYISQDGKNLLEKVEIEND
ncbi:hypothetical protein [Pontibacter roseus]|uniref:hypothetical protein n=1 Tax=Pontibacter roseus TaxID=336989 RepID=UPI0012F86837|nr:hypothetical protein [Pontibacter roseus]